MNIENVGKHKLGPVWVHVCAMFVCVFAFVFTSSRTSWYLETWEASDMPRNFLSFLVCGKLKIVTDYDNKPKLVAVMILIKRNRVPKSSIALLSEVICWNVHGQIATTIMCSLLEFLPFWFLVKDLMLLRRPVSGVLWNKMLCRGGGDIRTVKGKKLRQDGT